jgi:hypothetical protein
METKMGMVKFGVCLLVFVMACNSVQSFVPKPEGVVSTPVPTVVEPGLAYGEPCRPPCWREMIPGKTTRQEAARAIELLRVSGWASRIHEGPAGYSIDPLPSTLEGSIGVDFKDDRVNIIDGTIIFDFSAGKMIDQFGEPEGLYIVTKSRMTKETCETWKSPESHPMSSPVHVLYPKQGLWFLVLVPLNGLGLICPEMKVTAFGYYSPRSISEMLVDKDLTDLIVALQGAKEQDLAKWHGFGSGY